MLGSFGRKAAYSTYPVHSAGYISNCVIVEEVIFYYTSHCALMPLSTYPEGQAQLGGPERAGVDEAQVRQFPASSQVEHKALLQV